MLGDDDERDSLRDALKVHYGDERHLSDVVFGGLPGVLRLRRGCVHGSSLTQGRGISTETRRKRQNTEEELSPPVAVGLFNKAKDSH